MTQEEINRLELWPDAMPARPIPLSDPPVTADPTREALLITSTSLCDTDAFQGAKMASLPGTFYWRELRELDVNSLEALASFANTYGTPFVPRIDGPTSIEGLRVHASGDPMIVTFSLPAEEVRDAVRLLRNSTRMWQFAVDAISLDEFRERWEPCDPHGAFPMARMDEPPPYPDALQALNILSLIVTNGVREFAPYVRLNAQVPVATLFGATCAQIFNAIREERVWHRCAKCGEPFLRRWTTDSVQYCGPRCAKAAASQAYRDRKRQERTRLT